MNVDLRNRMKEGHYFVPGIDLLLLYWTLTLAVNLSPGRVPVIITEADV